MNNITRHGFDNSLEDGRLVEALVLGEIKRLYPLAFSIPGRFSGADIFVPEKGKYIEVKHDAKSLITGNYFIEFEMFSKRSGLMITCADYWVIYDGEDLVWVSPDSIKNIIIWNELKARKFNVDEEMDSARAFLIPRGLIREAGMVYKIKKI